nr:IS630 family transposase [Anoxybacillus tepidamans]
MRKKGLQITNDHGWTIERLQEQERKMKKANMAKRIAVIRLIMQGYLGIQVAELLNLHRETVSIYVQKFNQGGMDTLLERRYAPGRKPYLSPEEERELKKMLEESTPADEGYGIETGWNTRIIQHVLEEKFSVTMSRGGIGDMLHRWGFRYTRPTYTLKRANPQKQKEFQQEMELIKKTCPTTWS